MTTHHRIATSGIVALALAATASPATARQFDLTANGSNVPADSQLLSQASASSTPTIVRITPGNRGFDWEDAGIGAAGGLAISMIGLGGALALSQRRTRRTDRAPAASSSTTTTQLGRLTNGSDRQPYNLTSAPPSYTPPPTTSGAAADASHTDDVDRLEPVNDDQRPDRNHPCALHDPFSRT